MANKIFSWYSSGKNKDVQTDQHLIVEIAANHVACMVKNGNKQTINSFELFKHNKEKQQSFEEAFGEVLVDSALLCKAYDEISLFIQNDKSLLVPAEHFDQSKAKDYLNLVFGEAHNDEYFTYEFFNNNEIVNVYRIPSDWLNTINQSIKSASTRHTYTKITSNIFNETKSDADALSVWFYEEHLVLTVLINDKLNLVQTFNYQTPEDVLYFLLNICQQFKLETEKVLLQISGEIDLQSFLFNELKKCFGNLSVEELNESTAHIHFGDYQKHYLIPFFNLAK